MIIKVSTIQLQRGGGGHNGVFTSRAVLVRRTSKAVCLTGILEHIVEGVHYSIHCEREWFPLTSITYGKAWITAGGLDTPEYLDGSQGGIGISSEVTRSKVELFFRVAETKRLEALFKEPVKA